MPVYRQIVSAFIAMENCARSNNGEWLPKHKQKIEALVNNGPWGGGLDVGACFDYERSNENKLVFATSFHHMDEHGSYDGWSDHQVIVTPSLFSGIDVRVTGRNRNDIKEYIADVFGRWLEGEG